MTTHAKGAGGGGPESRSLPSFAQTFNSPSMRGHASTSANPPSGPTISADTSPVPDLALPPIQRKRGHSPSMDSDDIQVKQEPPNEPVSMDAGGAGRNKRKQPAQVLQTASGMAPAPHSHVPLPPQQSQIPPPPQQQQQQNQNQHPAPTPVSSSRPNKKRRVTISEGTRRQPFDASLADEISPISPVVVGFSIPSSDPRIMDQVRKTITLKHQQKAIIEQRKMSVSGPSTLVTPATPIMATNPNVPPGPNTPSNPAGRNAASNEPPRRPSISGPSRSPVPPPPAPPAQQPAPWQIDPATSFSQRRGMLQQQPLASPRKAPNLTIKPPAPQMSAGMQPLIQSAPPIPGQLQSLVRGGRVARSMLGGEAVKVPVLPNLSGYGNAGGLGIHNKRAAPPQQQQGPQQPHGGPPPIMRVQSSSSLSTAVPRTPGRLHVSSMNSPTFPPGFQPPPHLRAPQTPIALSTPRYPQPLSLDVAGGDPEKASFLGLFSHFYDSLADSRRLKGWLQEQLTRSNSMMGEFENKSSHLLSEFQARSSEVMNTVEKRAATGGIDESAIERLVGSLVERQVGGLKQEVHGLKKRVRELEAELKAKGGAGGGSGSTGAASPGGRLPGGSSISPTAPPISPWADGPHQSFEFPPRTLPPPPPTTSSSTSGSASATASLLPPLRRMSTSPSSLPSILVNGGNRDNGPLLVQRHLLERLPPIPNIAGGNHHPVQHREEIHHREEQPHPRPSYRDGRRESLGGRDVHSDRYDSPSGPATAHPDSPVRQGYSDSHQHQHPDIGSNSRPAHGATHVETPRRGSMSRVATVSPPTPRPSSSLAHQVSSTPTHHTSSPLHHVSSAASSPLRRPGSPSRRPASPSCKPLGRTPSSRGETPVIRHGTPTPRPMVVDG